MLYTRNMSYEQGLGAPAEAEQFKFGAKPAAEKATAVAFGEDQFYSESPTYEFEPQPADTLHTSYGKVFLERTLEEHPNRSEQETADAERVFAEFDHQQFENLEIVESSRYPGVKFTKSTVHVSPETMRRIYGNESNAADSQDTIPAQPTAKKTIVLWGSFAAPPDGHALSMGDAIFDRAIQEIGMVSNRMGSQHPIEVEIQILGAPTGLGGEVTPEYVKDFKQRGLDASSDMYAEYIQEHILPPGFIDMPPEQQAEVMQDQQFVFEGASRGAILADKAYSRMPESIRQITARRLDNPAGHHGDSKLWMLKGLQAGFGLVGEFARNLIDKDRPLRELMAQDKKLYAAMRQKFGIPDNEPKDQAKLKNAAMIAELKTLGRGESLSEDATRRYIVHAVNDLLTMNPYKRSRKLRHVKPGTLAHNMSTTNEGKEFLIEGGHFFKPFERYASDEDGNLGSWWRMINAGRRMSDEVAQKAEGGVSETDRR